MRTTLTLDPDVASRLNQLRETQDDTLKTVVNRVLRVGLDHLDESARERPRYQTKPLPLGTLQLANVDDIAEALALAEGETFK